jgi:hypothetical protein
MRAGSANDRGSTGRSCRVRRKALWTGSAWAHRTGLASFDRSEPHQSARRSLRSAILAPAFVVWTCPAEDLPVPWKETRARLAAIGN